VSNEAMTWALRDAPDVPSHAVAVLLGLANHADPNGRGAFPSQPTLAEYARKDVRQVRRDIEKLELLKLIRRGEQRLVAYLPADKRPVVWDLAMERVKEFPEPETTGRPRPAGRPRPVASVPPDADDRPDLDVPSPPQEPSSQDCDRTSTSGGTPTSGRTYKAERQDVGVRQTILEPTTPTAEVGSGEVGARKRAAAPSRGTRIPDDFHITKEMWQWGNDNFPHLDGESQTEAFVDYWKSVPGAKGMKVDWIATWRTWIRRAAERQPAANGHAVIAARSPRPSTTDQRIAELRAAGERAKAQIYGSNP